MITIYYDLETGGLLDDHPNIQLAAAAVDHDWNELAHYQAKIQFDYKAADPEALEINHYDPDVWEREALPQRQVVIEFRDFLNRFKVLHKIARNSGRPYKVAQLAGHNVSRFDGDRLKQAFAKYEVFMPADYRQLDTCQLAMWLFHKRACYDTTFKGPADLKLATLAEYFQIPTTDAHDALADVRMNVQVARALENFS